MFIVSGRMATLGLAVVFHPIMPQPRVATPADLCYRRPQKVGMMWSCGHEMRHTLLICFCNVDILRTQAMGGWVEEVIFAVRHDTGLGLSMSLPLPTAWKRFGHIVPLQTVMYIYDP